MPFITELLVRDIRFPTSRSLDGSDAMNPDPDYSAAYVILKTDSRHEAHGLTFTIGRGNEICVAAVQALKPLVVGKSLESFTGNLGAFWRMITGDSQLRWIGPEKGAIHLATAAVVNAVWDLYAKSAGKPLWKLLAAMSPEQLVSCVDFRYLTDAITPDEAVLMLRQLAPTKNAREAQMLATGYPAYTTSAGWLGYSDEKLRRLCREAVVGNWSHSRPLRTLVDRRARQPGRRARACRHCQSRGTHRCRDWRALPEPGYSVLSDRRLPAWRGQ